MRILGLILFAVLWAATASAQNCPSILTACPSAPVNNLLLGGSILNQSGASVFTPPTYAPGASLQLPAATGTGSATSWLGGASGQLLIGNGSGFTLGTLTAGTNVTINNSPGGITINSTGGGGGSGNVPSVFGRMGNVVGQYADYKAKQIAGLGGMAFQSPNYLWLTGGRMDGVSIGLNNPKFAKFLGYGYVTVPVVAGTNTLTLAQYENQTIVLTGTLSGNATLFFPAGLAGGRWDIVNNTTGPYTVSPTTAGQMSPPVAGQGQSGIFWSEGVGIYQDSFATVTNFASISGYVQVGQMCSGTSPSPHTYLDSTCHWSTPTGITPINIITLTQVTCGTGTSGSCIDVACQGGLGVCTQVVCTASTSNCTYTPSAGMVRILVQGAGQGGGGAGGGESAAGVAATGGGGGGGAFANYQGLQYTAADIAAVGGSVAITMGTSATGLGGLGAVANNTAGSPGVAGLNTVFGSLAVFGAGGFGSPGNPSGTASAGGAGGSTSAGGNASGTGGGAAGSPCSGSGGSTGAAGGAGGQVWCGSGAGGSPTNGGIGSTGGVSWFGSSGGGAGGGITSLNAGSNGGPGGGARGPTTQTPATGGTSSSPNGQNGTTVLASFPGNGGGGGYGNPSGAGGNGGNGANAGGGGGGGGACRNGSTCGNGGNGGNGEMTITESFS